MDTERSCPQTQAAIHLVDESDRLPRTRRRRIDPAQTALKRNPGVESAVRRWTSLVGVVFFVVLTAAVVTQNPPGTSSSAGKVLAYYTDHRTASRISGLLTVISVVVGILFYGLLRDHLRQDDRVRGPSATASAVRCSSGRAA
jgi:hypothetical protein